MNEGGKFNLRDENKKTFFREIKSKIFTYFFEIFKIFVKSFLKNFANFNKEIFIQFFIFLL
jgi:hypothetical protein